MERSHSTSVENPDLTDTTRFDLDTRQEGGLEEEDPQPCTASHES